MRDYPLHTPYARKSGTFQIGLHSLGDHSWIEVDERLKEFLDEKRRLFSEIPEKVYVAQRDTGQAQREVLDFLQAHLLEKYPDIFKTDQDNMIVGKTGHSLKLGNSELPALLQAAFMVPEDLVIMRKTSDGWSLVAASVSFPSSWSLMEKFSKPLHKIHKPVPGFGKGTRNAMMIERIFDNLPVGQPVERFNWSVYSDSELYHSDRSGEYLTSSLDSPGKHPHLRVERQTLHKLPKTGDILFTIRIHIDPLQMLKNHPERDDLVPAFVESIRNMDTAQLAYKGIGKERDILIKKIHEMAGTTGGLVQ